MYNARYHVASLVAVFLSLAVGLVLGGLVVRSGAATKQQSALVSGLRQEFADLRGSNDELTKQNQMLTSFSAAMTDMWVVDRLKGKTFVVVVGPGRNDGLNAISKAVTDAGGKVATVTLLKPGFGLTVPGVQSQVASITGASEPNLRSSVASALASEWTSTGPRPVTKALKDAGVLSLERFSAETTVAGVIDIAVSDGATDADGVTIAKAFIAEKVIAVGAQPLDSSANAAAAVAEAGGSGYETVGTDVGRYTLVALLSGAKRGLYGVAEGIELAFPALPK
jgi:hypothetical protein